MASLDEVHLAHAGFRLSVCPALGGAITRFALDDFDLLRPWDGSEQVRRTRGHWLRRRPTDCC